MAAVVCGHCGTSNAAGRQFCENCDGFLDWDGTCLLYTSDAADE